MLFGLELDPDQPISGLYGSIVKRIGSIWRVGDFRMGSTQKGAMLGAALLLLASGSMAQAASCYDLWYERNLIYAENGYCFSTNLGKRTFAGL